MKFRDPPRGSGPNSALGDVGTHSVSVSVRNSGSIVDLEDSRTLPITITFRSGALTAPRKEGMLARMFERTIGQLYGRMYDQVYSRVHPQRSALSFSVAARYASQAAGDVQRQSVYTPELNLMSESETSTSSTPAMAYDYIWFGGKPAAQVDLATSTTHWTFTDHLGTPILQTDATGTIDWRAEYEPFGSMYTLRTGATRHQPLRFPGQEADSLNGEREYNIFRWYRAGWGRYTQADPIGLNGGRNIYLYVEANPSANRDPLGLKCCRPRSITATRRPMTGRPGGVGIKHTVCADVEDSEHCEFKQVIDRRSVFYSGVWQVPEVWHEDYKGFPPPAIQRPSKNQICLFDQGVGIGGGLSSADYPYLFRGTVTATVYDPSDLSDSLAAGWTVNVTCSLPGQCTYSSRGI
jgi:RHS repeat-associated protein